MKRIVLYIFSIVTFLASNARALSAGDMAPEFTLMTTDDSLVSLARYQGRVLVLRFICARCQAEQGPLSAVEKYIWQAFRSLDVEVLGIETMDEDRDSVMSFTRRMGITFPVALRGHETAAAYGNAGAWLILIDKQGVIRAISSPGLSSIETEQINNTVKSFAAMIPALLVTSTAQLTRPAPTPILQGNRNGSFLISDLSGRKIDARWPAQVSRLVVDGGRGLLICIKGSGGVVK